MAYKLTLSLEERHAFDWIGDRYAWGAWKASLLSSLPASEDCLEVWEKEGEITFDVAEHVAWTMREQADEDAEGGHSRFPCAAPDLERKLNAFCDSLI